MTVSSTTLRDDYTGNGVTTAFTGNFRILDQTHIQVLRTQISTGIATTLALTTDYTVSGVGAAQFTVTCLVAPTSGQRLSILRNVPLTQLTDYVPNDPFPAESHEAALDKLTMVDQQQQEQLDRALTLSANSVGVSTALPTPAANNLIGWDLSATALQNYDSTALGISLAYAAWRTDTFNGTGAQTTFVLADDAGVASNCAVSVGGVMQTPGINFSYDQSTRTINFLTGAPPLGTNNVAVRYGQALPTGVGTVTAANITDSTATGRSVLTAVDAAAGRSTLGAAQSGANNDITSLTALTAGGLPDNSVTTNDIANAAVTAPKLSGAQTGSAPIYAARAWCIFDGTVSGTNAPLAGGNVTSVTRNSTGDYTINFATAMPDANYCAVFGGLNTSGVNVNYVVRKLGGTKTTSAFQILVVAGDRTAAQDNTDISVAIFR